MQYKSYRTFSKILEEGKLIRILSIFNRVNNIAGLRVKTALIPPPTENMSGHDFRFLVKI